MNLFEKLEFIFECLSSVLGVDMQQRLVVQVLRTSTLSRIHNTSPQYTNYVLQKVSRQIAPCFSCTGRLLKRSTVDLVKARLLAVGLPA